MPMLGAPTTRGVPCAGFCIDWKSPTFSQHAGRTPGASGNAGDPAQILACPQDPALTQRRIASAGHMRRKPAGSANTLDSPAVDSEIAASETRCRTHMNQPGHSV